MTKSQLKHPVWTKKYEPTSLDEIVGHNTIIERLRSYSQTKSFPNLVFSGPTGVGKTVSAKCFANSLYHTQLDQNILHMDGAWTGGRTTMQDGVTRFIRTDSRNQVPRLIIIEHAESLYENQQDILRALLEQYQKNIRVIITCTTSSEIHSGLQSQSVVFRFEPVSVTGLINYIQYVCDEEDIKIESGAIEQIHKISNGDLREATNLLQAIATEHKDRIETEDVISVTSHLPTELMTAMISEAMDGNYDSAVEKLNLVLSSGFSGEDIVSELYDIAHDMDIDAEERTKITNIIGDVEYRIQSGGDRSIQISSLLAEITLVGGSQET